MLGGSAATDANGKYGAINPTPTRPPPQPPGRVALPNLLAVPFPFDEGEAGDQGPF
jgi:hypothetical protein